MQEKIFIKLIYLLLNKNVDNIDFFKNNEHGGYYCTSFESMFGKDKNEIDYDIKGHDTIEEALLEYTKWAIITNRITINDLESVFSNDNERSYIHSKLLGRQ